MTITDTVSKCRDPYTGTESCERAQQVLERDTYVQSFSRLWHFQQTTRRSCGMWRKQGARPAGE
eukprot:scaffold14697_cov124-Cylindrotheca_fusiformis.AAC.7